MEHRYAVCGLEEYEKEVELVDEWGVYYAPPPSLLPTQWTSPVSAYVSDDVGRPSIFTTRSG